MRVTHFAVFSPHFLFVHIMSWTLKRAERERVWGEQKVTHTRKPVKVAPFQLKKLAHAKV